jgi:N-acetylneuraminate synthase
MRAIEIDGRLVGDNQPVYCVAEIGSNFDGDLDRAKYLIDLAKKCGADAVKFQSFLTDKIISKEGFKNLKKGFQAKWKKPVYDVYKDAEFPREWHKEISLYCKKKKITFFSAPYDYDAVDLLESINVPVYKIGSGDITWLEFIEYIAMKNKPIILGTGASTIDEIKDAVETIKSARNNDLVLLQCVTNYPSSFENANIKAMLKMKWEFKCLVGCSDHTPGSVVPLGMTALGGCIIEKHFTDDKKRQGPDHPFAMDADDFKKMVDDIRNLEKALGEEKKIYNEEEQTVILQRRCIRAAKDIKKGTVIKRNEIDVLRPAPKDSIFPNYIDKIVGKKILKDVDKGEHLTWEILER